MKSSGKVEAIHITQDAGEPMKPVEEVTAVAGRGLDGDRYYQEKGTFSDTPGDGRHLTLIEAEAIAAVERDADITIGFGEHRRNITTRNVPLNHLVNEEFMVGEVRCIGRRLCEPCSHLESLTTEGVVSAFVHRGGLRADILDGGVIEVDDEITQSA